MTCNHTNLKDKLEQAQNQYEKGSQQLEQLQTQLLQISGAIQMLQQLVNETESTCSANDDAEELIEAKQGWTQ